MDCDVPPKKIAKFDENAAKSRSQMLGIQEDKLEILLDASRKQISGQQSGFFPQGLNVAFTILNDNAIDDWEPHMHDSINTKCHRLLELCIRQLDEDRLPVLDLLGMILNPDTKFHSFNEARMSESVPPESDIPDKKLYARPLPSPSNPRGWLVDLINRFGELGGFIILFSRFQRGRRNLTIRMIHALLRPFGLCHELLTVDAIVRYLMPIIERVQVILGAITDEELKEEAKTGVINQDILTTIKDMKNLVFRVPKQEKVIQNLESLKLRLIFRLFQTVRHINDSLAKLDSDLTLEQWDNVLKYFPTSWKTANEKTRVTMLKLLQQWAKDFKPTIGRRVLMLLWDFAHMEKISTEIMEQAFSIHVEILASFGPYNHDDPIFDWLDKCVEDVKSNDKWALPALNQIDEICDLFELHQINQPISRVDAIRRLEEKHSIFTLIINGLTNYLDKVRELVQKNPKVDEITLMTDGWYNHETQVEKRLYVLKCQLRCGESCLNIDQINTIWQHLVEQPIFLSDKEAFFKWFSALDLDPAVIKDFFKQNFLELDPSVLTESGIHCFEEYFIKVNSDDDGRFKVDNLIGIDFLWRVVTTSPDETARQGFRILKETHALVGEELKLLDADIHRTFIAECRKRLLIHSDALSRLTGVETIAADDQKRKEIGMETRKMGRIIKFMEKYTKKCGWDEN